MLLVGPFGLPGLGLAIAIAAWVETVYLLVFLRRHPARARRPADRVSLALRSLVVAIGGGLAAAGVSAGLDLAFGADASRTGLVVRIVSVGFVWLLTSAAIALVLRISELARDHRTHARPHPPAAPSVTARRADGRPGPGRRDASTGRCSDRATTRGGTSSSPPPIPAPTSSSSGWARVKAVNGWGSIRSYDERRGRSAPRSCSAVRARCHGHSPTRRAGP